MCHRASRARSSSVAQQSSSSSRRPSHGPSAASRAPSSWPASPASGRRGCCASSRGRAADRGVRTLRGDCPAFGAGELAYAPIASALRRLGRELDPAGVRGARRAGARRTRAAVPEWASAAAHSDPTASGDAFAQARLFVRLRGLLDRLAADAPLLVAVEDLHWADRSTLELLSSLLRGLRDERLLLVCTYRSDELHRRHPLRPFLAEEERREVVQRVELEPFSPTELAAQVEGILGGAARSRARRAPARALRGQRFLRRGAARRLGRRGRPAASHAPRDPRPATWRRCHRTRARSCAWPPRPVGIPAIGCSPPSPTCPSRRSSMRCAPP